MKRIKIFGLVLQAVMIGAFFGLNGCKNNNLFGKLNDRGSSDDPVTLATQASVALSEKNYAQALDLAEKALSKNGRNSEALQVAAAAVMGSAGFNSADLIAELLKNDPASSVADLGDLINQSVLLSGPHPNAGVNSIFKRINFALLGPAIARAICYYRRIVSGGSDDSRGRDNYAACINLALLHLLSAGKQALDNGIIDVEKNSNTIRVVLGNSASTVCGDTAKVEVVQNMGKDLAAAYALLRHVSLNLTLSSSNALEKARLELDTTITSMLTNGSSNALPAGCLTSLSQVNINSTSFRTYDPFTPPTGC